MSYKDKKLAVFQLLQQINGQISLLDITKQLGTRFSERSVRRWLSELIEEGLVEKIGKTKSAKYAFVKKTLIIDNQTLSKESEAIIAQVRKPLNMRLPTAYASDWIASYTPNKTFYIPREIRAYLRSIGSRSVQNEPAGTYAHHIYNRLLIDLSYNSSRLEGNTYSLLDTQKLVLEGEGAVGKPDEEKLMILNHKEAIRYLVDQAAQIKIQTETISTLHYLLSDGLVDAHFLGVVRNCVARIGGSTYIPYENPKELQRGLQRITEKAAQIEDAFEQSFFLLVHVSYLQAFVDVNKRTARLSANIPLIKKNFAPLSFNDIDKDDYIAAILAIYELQEVGPLLDLYLFSYRRTCALYDATVKASGFDVVRVKYRSQRRAILREIILQNLHGEKMNHYIRTHTHKLVPKEDQSRFVNNVFDDIQEMAPYRLVGLGVTREEFFTWQNSK